MNVPAALPLEQGRVTCTTCHDAGMDDPPGSHHAGIRITGGDRALCLQCHQPSSGPASAHATSGTLRAHLVPDTSGQASTLDQESRSCMACHDGARAEDTGGRESAHDLIGPDQSHPIGIRFVAHGPNAAGEGAMVNPAALDPRLRLFGQEVGCGTCHSLYSRHENLLVMSNMKSHLCLSCHVE